MDEGDEAQRARRRERWQAHCCRVIALVQAMRTPEEHLTDNGTAGQTPRLRPSPNSDRCSSRSMPCLPKGRAWWNA
jgi:hypothetical protein